MKDGALSVTFAGDDTVGTSRGSRANPDSIHLTPKGDTPHPGREASPPASPFPTRSLDFALGSSSHEKVCSTFNVPSESAKAICVPSGDQATA